MRNAGRFAVQIEAEHTVKEKGYNGIAFSVTYSTKLL